MNVNEFANQRMRNGECFPCAADDDNEEWDGAVRKTEGGRVQGRAVVSRFIGQGCGGCKEAQMGRTLSRCVTETHRLGLEHKDAHA